MRLRSIRGEFSFVWFFAIIAGLAILLLSIYGATRIGGNIEVENEATIAKKLTILTDPLEAGFTSATFGTITFQRETEVKVECDDFEFGSSSLSARVKSDVNTGNSKFSVPVSSTEKYIFGPEDSGGLEYYVLSQGFEFPFKIADFVVLIPDSTEYCFENAPENIFDELSSLQIPNIQFDNCSSASNARTVCFGGESCDISVTGTCTSCQDLYARGTVSKGSNTLSYADNLLYPAIFSSSFIYDCNVNRLLHRGSVASQILVRKADLMNARGCTTNLAPQLGSWSGLLQNASSDSVSELHVESMKLSDAARWEVCSVW